MHFNKDDIVVLTDTDDGLYDGKQARIIGLRQEYTNLVIYDIELIDKQSGFQLKQMSNHKMRILLENI